jgi:hypothetical protein
MTKDDLDLARAKDIAERCGYVWEDLDPIVQGGIFMDARTIRLGDEARGLRAVPVVATKQMMAEGGQVASGYVFEGAKLADDMWDAMIAASPFAPGDET